jgi:hypothetical protein
MGAYFLPISNEERQNILDKHKYPYDGYVLRYQQNSEPQPLYIQDFANDKEGVTVSNTGKVTGYKNMGINESLEEKTMCECGSGMYEGECMECGGSGYMEEDEMTEDIGTDKLKMGSKYKMRTPSYSEDDLEFTGETPYGEADKSMYSFKGPKSSHSMTRGGVENFIFEPEDLTDDDLKDGYAFNDDLEEGSEDIYATDDIFFDDMYEMEMVDENDWKEMDEEFENLDESFYTQKNRINEMFKRFSNYN